MGVIMKRMIHEIHNGKNIKNNLYKYKAAAAPVYEEYAALELTFSAYTMLQVMVEEKPELAKREERIVSDILSALGSLGSGDADREVLISRMKGIRQQITAKMELFTNCTDRLIVYEYVLNRMEMQYLPEKELDERLASFDENYFMQKMSEYLFASQDQSVIREKVQEVMGQIPVHMTKNRFFQQLGESMTLFKDGDRTALDNFIYMIRTSAMLYEPGSIIGEYPLLEEILRKISSADYTDMDQKTYEEMAELLKEGSRQVTELTDFYYNLQQVVNGIYAVCLIRPYQESDGRLVKACRSIWVCLSKKEYRDEMLQPLEGRIEGALEEAGVLEAVLYEIKNSCGDDLGEPGMIPFFDDLVRVVNLLSDSLFIDLERVAENEKADGAYVQKRTEELVAELTQKLSDVSRPVKRAIMGQIIGRLPLAFRQSGEIMEYIRVNLMGCQNKSEKCVVMMILWDLICKDYSVSLTGGGDDSLV